MWGNKILWLRKVLRKKSQKHSAIFIDYMIRLAMARVRLWLRKDTAIKIGRV